MLVKRSSDEVSDVTPREIYVNLRKFLYGMGLAGGLALAGKAWRTSLATGPRLCLQNFRPGGSPFSTNEKVTPEQS
jgi:hypothetical protein